MPAIVIDIFREGLAEVKDAVKEVNASVAALREEAVHRREFDRYREERLVEWQAGQAKHDRDIADLRAEADKRAAATASLWRWLIATGSAACIGIAGVVTGVIEHFH